MNGVIVHLYLRYTTLEFLFFLHGCLRFFFFCKKSLSFFLFAVRNLKKEKKKKEALHYSLHITNSIAGLPLFLFFIFWRGEVFPPYCFCPLFSPVFAWLRWSNQSREETAQDLLLTVVHSKPRRRVPKLKHEHVKLRLNTYFLFFFLCVCERSFCLTGPNASCFQLRVVS